MSSFLKETIYQLDFLNWGGRIVNKVQIYMYLECFRIFFRQKLLLIKEKFQTHKTLKIWKVSYIFFFFYKELFFSRRLIQSKNG